MIAEQLYFKPKTIEEVIFFSEKNSDFRFLAGGTDLLVNKFQGNENAKSLIDVSEIDELKQVARESDFLQIGASVCLDDLKNHPEIKNEFPVLIEAAESVATPVIRKTATIGGNLLCENRCIFYNQSEWWRNAAGNCLKCDGDICIATGGKKKCFSKFSSDMAVALIAVNAEIEIICKQIKEESEKSLSPAKSGIFNKGEGFRVRRVPLEDIYTGDGIESKNLKCNELIKSVLLPLEQNFRTKFYKLRQRESVDFTSLTTCISLNKNGKIKIVVGGVDPKPVVVEGTKNDNKNELIKQAVKKSRIVDNDVFSRKYRKEMISVFLKRSFEKLSL